MTEPQPIETAPRDGTIVNLLRKDGAVWLNETWWCDDKSWTGFPESDFTHWVLSPGWQI